MSETAKDAIIDGHNLCGDDRGCQCEEAREQASDILSTAVVTTDVNLEVLRDAWRKWYGLSESDRDSETEAEFDSIIFDIRHQARKWAAEIVIGGGPHRPLGDDLTDDLFDAYNEYALETTADPEAIAAAFSAIIDSIRAKTVYEAIGTIGGIKARATREAISSVYEQP